MVAISIANSVLVSEVELVCYNWLFEHPLVLLARYWLHEAMRLRFVPVGHLRDLSEKTKFHAWRQLKIESEI